MIINVIALLFPAGFASLLHNKIIKDSTDNNVFIFGSYALLINLMNFIIVYFIFGHNELYFTVIFTIKYILVSLVNMLILLFINYYLCNYVKINVNKVEDKK